jgi:hypothetical protein
MFVFVRENKKKSTVCERKRKQPLDSNQPIVCLCVCVYMCVGVTESKRERRKKRERD